MRLLEGEKLRVTFYTADGIEKSHTDTTVQYSMSTTEFALRFAEHLPPGTYLRLHGRDVSTGLWTITYIVGRMAGEASVTGASLPLSASGFLPFPTWNEVLAYVREGKPVYYKAPMDVRPVRVLASVRGKGQKVRVATGAEAGDFWADAGHLNRFFRRAS